MKRSFTSMVVILVLCSWLSPAMAAPRPKRKSTSVQVTAPMLPRLAVDADGMLIPEVHAAAAVVYDPDTHEVLYDMHGSVTRSIASITKVMTASVVLESAPDLTALVTIQSADTHNANHTYLRPRDRVTVDDLLHLMLIASDNAAARALARISPLGTAGFIQRMNEKASELGLAHTAYADPSGLLKANMSTAFDMAQLITAVSGDEYIASVMQMPGYSLRTVAKRFIAFSTTDRMLRATFPIVAAKTGFTNPAGFCFASFFRLSDVQRIAIVVLGARSNAERFYETENLFKWVQMRQAAIMQPVTAHLSEQGQSFIKTVEGFRPTPYKDSRGWAVGYGMHYWNGQAVTRRYPVQVTQDEADVEFAVQMARFEMLVPSVPTQGAYDALVSVAYNLGRVNTRILDKLTLHAPITPSDFLSTATVHRRPFAGLALRRLREFAVFAGDYTGTILSR